MAESKLTPQTIMVVEDERITAEDIRLRLESWGYRVPAVVDTGEDAIRAAEQLKPDLMLVDIHLKGSMDGVEAAQRIRQHRDIPVIYATAHLDLPTVKRAHIADSFGFINKPYEDREMRSAIELTLLKRQLERRVAEVEERYRKVVGRVSEMVLITRRWKILSANDAAERPGPARVLVVDDDETARTITRRMLESLGCMVDECATGDEAIAAVRDGLYELLLLDCHMGGRDGYSTAAEIRRCEQDGRQLRIVALTADGDEPGRERCRRAGMDGHLTKPVHMNELNHLLTTLA